ncbi:MAG: crossover junction endodeoxyribonuclease RuvC [Chitinophagales bacterium]|jgi:crossover junction endodeoxyribonuclease RuvC|nr:crossover junction endodeoxyribonuclease RuvC [Sphingobacteriales bacterium]MBP7534446.1 crossover junction endodeoxyribonuclease RuvC [Chitinophagales bacterium]
MTRKIIGIDPGTTVMGYAIIEVANQKITIETVGVVRLHKYSDHYEKLQKIFEKVSALIVAYQPKEMAIEAPFYAQNVQSMLKLGRAQGVAIAAAMVNGLSVEEYQPRKIKQSITGNGNASKEQVAAMLQNMLSMDIMPSFLDATDALAAAVCHHLQTKALLNATGKATEKFKDWKSFVDNNKDKVKKS